MTRLTGRNDPPERRLTMSNTRTLIVALGAIALATAGTSALALGWPNLPAKRIAQSPTSATEVTARVAAPERRGATTVGDFEYIGGESGWSLRQHRMELRGGAFGHAADCTLMAQTSARAVKAEEPVRETFRDPLPGA